MTASKEEIEHYYKIGEADQAVEILLEMIYSRKYSTKEIEKEIFIFFKGMKQEDLVRIQKRFFLMAGVKMALFTRALFIPSEVVGEETEMDFSTKPNDDDKPKLFLQRGIPCGLSKSEIEFEIGKAISQKNYSDLQGLEDSLLFRIASFSNIKFQNENDGAEPKIRKNSTFLEYTLALWNILVKKKNEFYEYK